MHHVGLLARETVDPFLVHPDAVRQRCARARDPDRIEVGDLILTRRLLDHLQLERRLGGVGVDRRARPRREVAHRAQQWSGATRHEPGSEAPAQPTLRRAVPLGAQIGRFLERPLGGLLQAGWRGRGVHQALARRRAETDRLEGGERRPGVPHRLHVEDRRCAAEQQLGRAQHRGPVHGFLGVRGFERPDAAREPVFEGEIVGEPAKQRLAEMDVGLHETRDDDHASTVDDLLRPSPSFSAAHRRDALPLHDHVPLHHSPFRIHRDHPRAGEAQRHVVTLGFARVVSSGRSK